MNGGLGAIFLIFGIVATVLMAIGSFLQSSLGLLSGQAV